MKQISPHLFDHRKISSMTSCIPRSLLAVALSLPSLAFAHPGHSAFDPTQMPHAGHEWERVAVVTLLVFAITFAVHTLRKRRR
jgi:hypothetical protein